MAKATGAAWRVMTRLRKGKPCDAVIAKKLGMGVRQYQQAIEYLKRSGVRIASRPVVYLIDGRRRYLAGHYLLKEA